MPLQNQNSDKMNNSSSVMLILNKNGTDVSQVNKIDKDIFNINIRDHEINMFESVLFDYSHLPKISSDGRYTRSDHVLFEQKTTIMFQGLDTES